MVKKRNPFIITGYAGPAYFCDRERESDDLISQLVNGSNVTLISPRRMGKSSLIKHCFHNEELKDYYTFFIDIYATTSLREFVYALGKAILNGLKSHGRKTLDSFLKYAASIKTGVAFDMLGNMALSLQLGDIQSPETTLDEIFRYLEAADRPCIVAIDEFQQIASYPEKNVEAILRTYVQQCSNSHFIFAGSHRHIMTQMFSSSARPFYMSASIMYLESIDLQKYIDFAVAHFHDGKRDVTRETVSQIYESFDGVTWYMQKLLNTLYTMTSPGQTCDVDMISEAVFGIIDSMRYSFVETMFRLPEKQKELLVAIAKAGKAKNITSGEFIQKYRLPSASSVQSATKGLLDKDFITFESGIYSLSDKFLSIWINERL